MHPVALVFAVVIVAVGALVRRDVSARDTMAVLAGQFAASSLAWQFVPLTVEGDHPRLLVLLCVDAVALFFQATIYARTPHWWSFFVGLGLFATVALDYMVEGGQRITRGVLAAYELRQNAILAVSLFLVGAGRIPRQFWARLDARLRLWGGDDGAIWDDRNRL